MARHSGTCQPRSSFARSAGLSVRLAACLTALLSAWLSARLAGAALAADPPVAALTLVGAPEIVFDAKRDQCDGDDVADTNARAFRDAEGQIVILTLHTLNRALRGPDFDRLKIVCPSPLPSRRDADPARYDDASWITATWTDDGRRVQALIHHEFQANTHPGRCRFKAYLACWYNTVVAARSEDGGRTFARASPPAVVAAAPFRQDAEQGRHRGFFNPSNIVADGTARYMMTSTTGWTGQDAGPCLFRTLTPDDPTSWRAFDGQAFSIRYDDPYRASTLPKPCRVIQPFPAPVGGIVRHRATRAWIAVFQAAKDGKLFPEPGFYATSSRDLLVWDKPRLLLAGSTLYDDPCGANGRLIAYPTLIDRTATGRNFDDVGDTAELYYAALKVEGCTVTSERNLERRRVAIRVFP